MRAAPKGVDEYFAALPPKQRKALGALRRQVRALAPGATEKISYGVPTFVLKGRNLLSMAAFKEHLSFFPGASGVTLALKGKLKGYKTARGTIQFTPERPIPAAIVKRIVKMRVADVEARTLPRPDEALRRALRANPGASAAYKAMPPSHQRRYVAYIAEAKREAAQATRVAKSVEMVREWGEERAAKPEPRRRTGRRA